MPAKKKVKTKIAKKSNLLSFQDIIMNLQKFWGKNGCVILQPYDIEVGAGTFHPATTLRSLGPRDLNVVAGWKVPSPTSKS